MVQEFHVLRCFSCQTFQVQQVKKSKKWSCKMCGEKQSLIKEYGRGTGADCRRHVQKLNSLRGELQDVENERAWAQWEKDEACEVEVGLEDETQRSQQKTEAVSRWSKYIDQKENGPGCDADEHEEEEIQTQSVYTDTEQRHQRNKISRKRKKNFTSGAACGHYTVDDDDNMDTAHWGATELLSQPRRHDGSFKSLPEVPRTLTELPCTSSSQRTDALRDSPAVSLGSNHISAYNCVRSQPTEAKKHSTDELSTRSQPLSSLFAPSKMEAKDSKWARFLPSVCAEEDKDDGDSGEHAQYVHVEHSALALSPVMPVATIPLKDTGCISSGGSEGALMDKEFSAEKVSIFEKLSHCVNGNMCKQPNTPTITSRPFEKPVCVQPPPTKRPCPSLSFSTLFHTDEDFDDTY